MKRFTLILVAALIGLLSGPAAATTLKPGKPRPAPAIELAQAHGGHVSLAQLRGQVVLVNFWATWCPPCRKEMPSMERLTQKLSGRPFRLLAVNTGETPEQIQAFLKEVPLTFPILLDPEGETMKAWRVFVLPTSFLVDKKGQIRYSLAGHLEWDEPEVVAVIERLLAE
ncbi:MAG: TlpA disulfide reductase family protein [Burkholderiales bacterium]|nr:TlpA disulfide reductase family protein [Burkholderiales bacterium]